MDDAAHGVALRLHNFLRTRDRGPYVSGVELGKSLCVVGNDWPLQAVRKRPVLHVVVRVLLPDNAGGRDVLFEKPGTVTAYLRLRVKSALRLAGHDVEVVPGGEQLEQR